MSRTKIANSDWRVRPTGVEGTRSCDEPPVRKRLSAFLGLNLPNRHTAVSQPTMKRYVEFIAMPKAEAGKKKETSWFFPVIMSAHRYSVKLERTTVDSQQPCLIGLTKAAAGWMDRKVYMERDWGIVEVTGSVLKRELNYNTKRCEWMKPHETLNNDNSNCLLAGCPEP